MQKHHRSSYRVLSRNPRVRRVVWAGTAGVAALCLAVTGATFAQSYDVFGSQAFQTDYSSQTWTKTVPSSRSGTSTTSTTGATGVSTGSSTSSSTTAALPAGAVAVTLNGTKAPVHYRDGSGEEKNAVGDWTIMKIYARSPLGVANYTQSVGVITKKSEGASYISGEGYIFPDKLPGAAKSTIVATTPTSTTATTTSSSSRVPSDDGAVPPPVIREALPTTPTPTTEPEPAAVPSATATKSTVTTITSVRTPTDRTATAAAVGTTVSAAQEATAAMLVTRVLGASTVNAVSESARAALVTYVAYGHTSETAKIGSGERASTVERFKLLYGTAPTSDTDFRALHAMVIESGADIVKVKRAIEAEKKGLGAFRRIYGYLPATTVKDQALIDAEWKALRIITYGLKPLQRDLAKERTAIRAYTAKFGTPKTIGDWDGIRACVYGSPTTCPLLR